MRTLTLNPDTHIYLDELGRTYASVTTLLKRLFPFNTAEVAQKVSEMPRSRYFGKSVTDILAEWNARRDAGSALHQVIESAMKGAPVASEYEAFVETFKAGSWQGKLKIETIVYDEELMMAGTADIIESRSREDVIWDIKTCRTIYDDKRVQHSAQITLYARMNQENTGRPTRPGGIIWWPDFPQCKIKPIVLKPVDCGNICEQVIQMRQGRQAA